MLKTTGKTVLLNIADSNPSPISNCSKGVMEDCKVSEPKDIITNVPTADAAEKDVIRWLESVQWNTFYLKCPMEYFLFEVSNGRLSI